MKLYYSPGACSLGIHVVLEEIGKPYDVELINVRDGAQFSDAFVAISPKSKIPALGRDDGSVLTEFGAIATWLARTNPAAKLIPADADAEARVMEAMDYIVATVHMQGFTRIARPANFTPTEADQEKVKARGREIYAKGLSILDKALGDKEWLAGEYSVADTALFYVCRWATRADTPLPPNLAAHLARMEARPAVKRALAAEGLT